jgi:hypothetical protein
LQHTVNSPSPITALALPSCLTHDRVHLCGSRTGAEDAAAEEDADEAAAAAAAAKSSSKKKEKKGKKDMSSLFAALEGGDEPAAAAAAGGAKAGQQGQRRHRGQGCEYEVLVSRWGAACTCSSSAQMGLHTALVAVYKSHDRRVED